MNATADALDWFARIAAGVGLPGVIVYYIRDRRKTSAEARQLEAGADVDERTIGDRVKTSSIATIEAEVAAMQRSFEISRAADAATMLRIQADNERLVRESAAKDLRIRELESKVQQLQARVSEVSDELARVSDELRSLHDDHNPGADPRH